MQHQRFAALLMMAAIAGCHAIHPTPGTKVDRRAQAAAIAAEAVPLDDAPPSVAAALSAADRDSASTVDTINAIRAARNLVLRDLRNADTIGYKSSRTSVPAGTRPATLQLDLTPGTLENTGRQLDIAIEGPGFLKVKIPDSTADGIGYTRNGTLFVNDQNEIVVGAGGGRKLVPPITLPQGATNVTISRDGMVECVRPGQNTKTRVGQLTLTLFSDPTSLTPADGSIYLPTDASGPPIDARPGESTAGTILQGFLESSNVDLLRARLRLQFLQRWESSLLTTLDRR